MISGETDEHSQMSNTERDAFEAWYCADATKDGMKFTPESVCKLREGNDYGDRLALNSKWEGWQARALQPGSVERQPFAEVYAQAYGWTLDGEGYLAGLVAGDMGYETTDLRLTDLFTNADVAEDKALFACGEFPCSWPVKEATLDFVDTCATALGIRKAS